MPNFPPMEEYHPSSPEEDESDCEPRRPYKTNNNILSHQNSVILEHHHLGDDTDLKAGTVISIGDTLELHNGSFLMTTELQRFKNDCSVKFFDYLFKPIGNFNDYLPVEFGDSELVWICEAAERDCKLESYWRCASSKDVLRIGLMIFTKSGHALEAFPKSQATRKFTKARPSCQWKLVTELSKPHDRRKERSFRSTLIGAQKQPRAFTALSDQDLSVVRTKKFLEIGNAFGIPKVDVLHLSPPCKGFSLALGGFSKNREESNECMKYVAEIVRTVEPRVVTLEEVPQEHFTAMVHALTSIGYNVRWKVVKCVGFGVPQKRKRLFMIASCRGESLPDFPKLTHSHPACFDELRLQPWNTFGGAIDHLEDSAPNHLLQHPRRERLENLGQPHSPDWPYCDTITTGENWPNHYSGGYVCTVRKAACLRGFPVNYEFCGILPATRQQVANAVPPPVAKAILEEIKRSLIRTDASKSS